MVVLAFFTHASFELCGFVGSWRAKGEGAPMHPRTLGVKVVDAGAVLSVASAATSLVDFLNKQLEYFTSKFLKIPLLPFNGDTSEHAKRLAELVETAQREGNVIVPQRQALVPEEPVEGTDFQRLMIRVLNDTRTSGLSAVHAEPGVGKSVATAMALRNYTEKSAVTVFLQRNFQKNLKGFFRVEDVADAVDVAEELFRILRERGVRLQIVFDNTFDTGLKGQENNLISNLLALTRAAHKFGHHLIVITQTEDAAHEVANLNGARTRLVEQQKAPSYRWSKGEAEEYLKAAKAFAGEAERVLNMTQVPDEVGGWKPVDIEEYLQTGRRPEAPQQGQGRRLKHAHCFVLICPLLRFVSMKCRLSFYFIEGAHSPVQGGRSTAISAVWVRQLQKDCACDDEFQTVRLSK